MKIKSAKSVLFPSLSVVVYGKALRVAAQVVASCDAYEGWPIENGNCEDWSYLREAQKLSPEISARELKAAIQLVLMRAGACSLVYKTEQWYTPPVPGQFLSAYKALVEHLMPEGAHWRFEVFCEQVESLQFFLPWVVQVADFVPRFVRSAPECFVSEAAQPVVRRRRSPSCYTPLPKRPHSPAVPLVPAAVKHDSVVWPPDLATIPIGWTNCAPSTSFHQ